VAEFISYLSITKLHKGDYEAAKDHLTHVCKVISPIIHPSADLTTLEDCLQAHPSTKHKDSCQCVCCTDPAIQSLQINFFIILSKYLKTMQEHRQSITALGIADELISNATIRLQSALEQFNGLLQLGSNCPDSGEDSFKSDKAKKKGRGKSSKTRQAKKPVATQDNQAPNLSSTIQTMFSCYLCQVFTQNADILLENNKVNKALEVLKGGDEVVWAVQTLTRSVPYWLIPDATSLLYLQGIVHVLQALQSDKTSLDSIWGNNWEKRGIETVEGIQETEAITKTKKRSAKGKGTKAKDVSMASNDSVVDDGEKTVKTKGRGRSKKTTRTAQDKQKECSKMKQTAGKQCKSILYILLPVVISVYDFYAPFPLLLLLVAIVMFYLSFP